jgi:hypothetical protein
MGADQANPNHELRLGPLGRFRPEPRNGSLVGLEHCKPDLQVLAPPVAPASLRTNARHSGYESRAGAADCECERLKKGRGPDGAGCPGQGGPKLCH